MQAPFKGDDGFFILDVGRIRLGPGRYWLSVQELCNFLARQTRWGWETSERLSGNPALFKSRGGFGCTEWNTLADCWGSYAPGPDFMFTLKGKDMVE